MAEAHTFATGARSRRPDARDVPGRSRGDPSFDVNGDPLERVAGEVDALHVLIGLLDNAERSIDSEHFAAHKSIGRALALLKEEERLFQVRRMLVRSEFLPHRGCLFAKIVNDYVTEHIESRIRVEQIASLMDLSVWQFSRRFRREFNTTPHHYIVGQRIEKAQQLMMMTADPLADIAVSCGFADQSHFSKWFTRLNRVPPGKWRAERQFRGTLD